jgi:superfamily II DNA helicase RecQ
MGVNKPNIRTVVHFELPKSLESYVQGVGRVGRDGNRAKAILLFSDADLDIIDRLHSHARYHRGSRDATESYDDSDALTEYAETTECRLVFLNNYFFSNKMKSHCGNCDNCKRHCKVNPRIETCGPVFRELRRWRRDKAISLGIPAFLILTDAEINKIALRNPLTIEGLDLVGGLRKPNARKYSEEILEITSKFKIWGIRRTNSYFR